MKDKQIKDETQPIRRDEVSLRIAGVEFTPTAGVEARLAKVFELLLAPNVGGSQSNE